MRYIKLSNAELELMNQIELKQKTKLHVRNRIQFLRLNNSGISMEEISKMYGKNYITMTRFFLKFDKERMDSIFYKKRSGCPRKIIQSEELKIIKWMAKSPRPLKEMIIKIETEFKKLISIDTLKRILKKNSYSYKRPKKSTRPFKGEDYDLKKKS